MRHLSVRELLDLHARIIAQSGGSDGVRDLGGLQSSLAQPLQTFDGVELYPALAQKAAALGFFLCANHPFVDGNKRVAHAATEVMLVLNGFELVASVDEQEKIMLAVASGEMGRDEFAEWVVRHTHKRGG